MNNQISYAPKAREDLLEIKSFIEEEAGDIELAKKTVSDIVTTNESLCIFPEMVFLANSISPVSSSIKDFISSKSSRAFGA